VDLEILRGEGEYTEKRDEETYERGAPSHTNLLSDVEECSRKDGRVPVK
jgi:hypothetical protein